MKCTKCSGTGMVENPEYYRNKHQYDTCYYLLFSPTRVCSKCKGSGYIIGKISEVLNFLEYLRDTEFRDNLEMKKQVIDCINTINK